VLSIIDTSLPQRTSQVGTPGQTDSTLDLDHITCTSGDPGGISKFVHKSSQGSKVTYTAESTDSTQVKSDQNKDSDILTICDGSKDEELGEADTSVPLILYVATSLYT